MEYRIAHIANSTSFAVIIWWYEGKTKKTILFDLEVIILGALVICLGLVIWWSYHVNTQSAEKEVGLSTSNEPNVKRTGSHTDETASIWAGYVTKDDNKYISVEGRVKVPKITCNKENDSFTAWVGFDGYNGDTVQQIGFAGTCHNASGYVSNKPIDGVTYYAWAMTYNAGNYDTFEMDIYPNDVMYYKVAYNDGRYDMTLRNETQQSSQEVSYTCEQEGVGLDICPRKMVEWIVERSGFGSMAEFPTVTLYDNKATTEDGKTHTPYDLDAYKLDMVQSGNVLAKPSDVTENGDFDVEWLATGEPGE